MALRLLLHACAVWPMSIDFDLFRAYTAGLSVDEAVDLMLATEWSGIHKGKYSVSETQSALPEPTPSAGSNPGKVSQALQQTEEVREEREKEGQPPLGLTPFSHGDPSLMETREVSASSDKGVSHAGGSNDGCRCGLMSQTQSFARADSRLTLQGDLQRVLNDAAVVTPSFLRQEVVEQFNLFDILGENYLASPYAFLSSYVIPMKLRDRRRVVEVYYRVDDMVLRFLFGKRLHKLEPDMKPGYRSFFSGRAKHDEKLRKLMEAGITEGSLGRQWANLKRVCTFLASAYRGRDEMLIPCTTPLLSALQQCFALRGSLGMRYATFVFGFEHKLTGRCWEKLSYVECTNICNVLASLWCDDSRLMLRESFCSVCARIARLLEENRIVAEMHQMAFGEAMRTRWQVQLDEVQRVIITNTGVGGVSNPHANCISAATIASPTTNVSPTLLPRNTSTLPLDAEGHTSPTLVTSTPTPPHGGNNATGNGNLSGAGAQTASASHNPYLSANCVFTRRFLIEFPVIIRSLARVATMIGNSGQIQEALDTFYTRVYLALGNMGVRSSHTQNVDAGSSRLGVATPTSDSLTVQEGTGASGVPSTVWKTTETTTNITTKTTGGPLAAATEGDLSFDPPRANQFEAHERLISPSGGQHTVINTSIMGPTVVSAPVRHHSQPSSPRFLIASSGGYSSNAIATVDSRMHLRELCMFLSLLPNIFSKLTIISEEDHTMCDSDFSNFVLSLKVLVQVLMASDDN